MQRHARHLLVVVECPQVEVELREKLRCPADIPIRCEHAEDVSAAAQMLARRHFDVVVVVTLGHDPRALVPLLTSARPDARVVVIGDDEEEVVRALDAGAAMAFERDRIPPGILPHILEVGTDDASAYSTMEFPVGRFT
jgi:DNA-binding NarL/FixJ family response regulator